MTSLFENNGKMAPIYAEYPSCQNKGQLLSRFAALAVISSRRVEQEVIKLQC